MKYEMHQLLGIIALCATSLGALATSNCFDSTPNCVTSGGSSGFCTAPVTWCEPDVWGEVSSGGRTITTWQSVQKWCYTAHVGLQEGPCSIPLEDHRTTGCRTTTNGVTRCCYVHEEAVLESVFAGMQVVPSVVGPPCIPAGGGGEEDN